jgi:hypothetical protein
MPRRSKSPIKLKCERFFSKREVRKLNIQHKSNPKICRWTCAAPFGVARFTNRHDDSVAIVHPSTKGYPWQVSFFDDEGPWGDIQANSCNDALKELHHRSWKLDTWKRRK